MNKWQIYLNNATNANYNVAHVNSMEDLAPNQVAKYVDRCMQIAFDDLHLVDMQYHTLIRRTLQWMDVAKCGSEADRAMWRSQCPGICLDIHNEASAEIYMNNCDEDSEQTKQIVYVLIKTHGLIGQYIMGETKLESNKLLQTLDIDKTALFKILKVLNHAIIGGVSEQLWKNVQAKVNVYITQVINGVYREDDTLVRLKKLFPVFKDVQTLTDEENALYSHIFANVNLWYPTVALQGFSRTELNTIFRTISRCDFADVKHVSFYDLSKELSYDRDGKRKENVYKKRVLEVLLREMDENSAELCEKEHVRIACEIDNDCLRFKVQFTPVCAALINFCVEAERSGFANYQKNIITLFDMFGFRRDIFDRLSNEEMYLETMNNAQHSTKMDILDFVQGSTIVDVGSGGGILLDELEKRFPDKMIAGTDISQNVIEALQKKIDTEEHQYEIWNHNFVNGALWSPVDTIIFSSIMHEIFSYTKFNGYKFNIDSVKSALWNAMNSLNHGGRLIIRDGVKTESNQIVSAKIKDEDMMTLARNYLKDFQGLHELKDRDGHYYVKIEDNVVTCNINLMREMLYTITWGAMSYPQEVQEQFGYFTLNEFVDFLESIGFAIIDAKEFTEPGYPEHLNDKVELIDFDWDDIPSNCIVVATKI